jgi:hypothetical protein
MREGGSERGRPSTLIGSYWLINFVNPPSLNFDTSSSTVPT